MVNKFINYFSTLSKNSKNTIINSRKMQRENNEYQE